MRKEWKSYAKSRLKKFYWIFLAMCIISGFLGIDYGASIDSFKGLISGTNNEYYVRYQVDNAIENIYTGKTENAEEQTKDYINKVKKDKKAWGIILIEHTGGIFADLTNTVLSNNFIKPTYNVINNFTKRKSVTLAIMIIVSIIALIVFAIFICNIYRITYTRIFMEASIYDKVSLNRFLFIFKVKKWAKSSLAMFRMSFYHFMWSLTIIGGFIKYYSYLLVPNILAENPNLSGKDAVLLSRKMMDGHKIEAFKLQLSFLGWKLLDILSFGLVGILFLNPYREMTKVEYYKYVRKLAIKNKIEGYELLNDQYLFEYAPKNVLKNAYKDVNDLIKESEEEIVLNNGARGFFENIFGVTKTNDSKEKKYETIMSKKYIVNDFKLTLENKMYPRRLFSLKEKHVPRETINLHYERHYSITSLILIFFTVCFIGWAWEVCLHLAWEGVFVNRGFLHGPWLPIYGVGVVLILMLLNKLRKHPMLLFIVTIIMCGILEYYTCLIIELTHNGMRWWDYTGYFLNIDGRVCAEGLLIFGLGGIATVYVLAPLLDNIFRRIPKKIAIMICFILISVFFCDQLYSIKYPNKGKGITEQENMKNYLKD